MIWKALPYEEREGEERKRAHRRAACVEGSGQPSANGMSNAGARFFRSPVMFDQGRTGWKNCREGQKQSAFCAIKPVTRQAVPPSKKRVRYS